MDNLTQQQIDTLIQNINDATDPASVTNIMVANVLAFLAAKVETMATASDLSTEATARETVDASLNQSIQDEVTARQNEDTALSGRITSLQDAFNTMMNGNVEDAIESFNEVINFLSEVTDEETLTGLLTQINNRIASVESNLNKKADLNQYTDKLSYDQAPDVVLASMGSTLDNVNNDSIPFVYIPGVDDVYWDDTTGHIKYVETTQYTRDLLGPKAGLIYCNKQTNLTYRWKGAQGWQQVGGSGQRINVVNNLTEGGGDAALSAEMGKQLKEMIDQLEQSGNIEVLDTLQSNSATKPLSARQGKLIYDNINLLLQSLRPSAFWDGTPELDWVGDVTTFEVTYNLSGCSRGSSSVSVAEGGTLVAELSPNTGYTLEGVTPTVTDTSNVAVAHTTSYNSTTGKLTITVVGVSTALRIGAAAVVLRSIDVSGLTNLIWDGPESVPNGGTVQGIIRGVTGYALPSSQPAVSGTHGAVTWDGATGSLTIANVTSNIAISATGQIAKSVIATLTNCTLDNINGVLPGATYEGNLAVRVSEKENGTVTWSLTNIMVKMGNTAESAVEVQNAYNSSTGKITVPNVSGNIYITAVAESSVKIVRGMGLSGERTPCLQKNTALAAKACFIGPIELTGAVSSDKISWRTGYISGAGYRAPIYLIFENSLGKTMWMSNDEAAFTATTITAQSPGRFNQAISSILSAASQNTPIRAWAAFWMEEINGEWDIMNENYIELVHSDDSVTRLFTAEKGLDAITPNVHDVSVNKGNTTFSIDAVMSTIKSVFDGKDLYFRFRPNSGYTIDSVVVTMGGDDISNNVVSTPSGSTHRVVEIIGVTGDVVITVNTSATANTGTTA